MHTRLFALCAGALFYAHTLAASNSNTPSFAADIIYAWEFIQSASSQNSIPKHMRSTVLYFKRAFANVAREYGLMSPISYDLAISMDQKDLEKICKSIEEMQQDSDENPLIEFHQSISLSAYTSIISKQEAYILPSPTQNISNDQHTACMQFFNGMLYNTLGIKNS